MNSKSSSSRKSIATSNEEDVDDRKLSANDSVIDDVVSLTSDSQSEIVTTKSVTYDGIISNDNEIVRSSIEGISDGMKSIQIGVDNS